MDTATAMGITMDTTIISTPRGLRNDPPHTTTGGTVTPGMMAVAKTPSTTHRQAAEDGGR